MRACVVSFPGSNREPDALHALTLATGRAPGLVWHKETELPAGTDLVVLPGGFSHGDYLRCGAIAARSPILAAVRAHAAAGRPVLGICNGFQILTEARLLPGALVRNATLRFNCKWVTLRVETSQTPFTRAVNAGTLIRVPVAHGEGNYTADEDTLDRLEGEGRVVFRYVTPDGQVTPEAAPNGSRRNIAGIANEGRNVIGLMPHPEDAVEAWMGSADGLTLFRGAVEALA